MKKIKKNKYRLGTQQVTIPNKGSVDDIASPTISLASTGGSIGSMFGPMGQGIGMGVGAIAGLTKGIGDFRAANHANKLATDTVKYNQKNDLVEDPHIMAQQQFKKGTSGIHIKKSHKGRFTEYKKRTGKTTEEALHSSDSHVRQMANFAKNASKWNHKKKYGKGTQAIKDNSKNYVTDESEFVELKPQYPGGTQGIKLTVEESQHLKNLQSKDPNGYKKAIHEMIGYKPTSAPAGSEVWKQANTNYNNAVNLINQGYHPGRYINTPKTDQSTSTNLQNNIINPNQGLNNNSTLMNYSDTTQNNQGNFVNKYNSQSGVDKKSAFISQYGDGTQQIELSPEEKTHLGSIKDPNDYRNAVWNILGYKPQKYPYGSDGWKTQEGKYNTAVDLINQGFRPNSAGNGYKRIYGEGTQAIKNNHFDFEFHKNKAKELGFNKISWNGKTINL